MNELSLVEPQAAQHKSWLLHQQQFRKQNKTEHLESQTSVISFVLGEGHYGIEMEQLKEILKPSEIIEVPGSKPYLKGLINLRSQLITIVDLNAFMGSAPTQIKSASRILVVKYQQKVVGLLVDSVKEIIDLDTSQIVPPAEHFKNAHPEFIRGVGELGEQSMVLLDLEKIEF